MQKWVPRNRPNIADQVLKDEFMGLAARQQANEDKKASIDSTVRAVLRSAATIGKLLEAWPEAVELLPDEIVQTTKTGLAIIPENLNSLVGIPSPK